LISFSFSCIATSIISIIFGVFVFSKNTKSFINIYWSLVCFSVGAWSLGLGLMVRSSTEKEALEWIHIHYFGAILIPIFFLHFVTALLKEDKKYLLKYLYSIALILQGVNFFDLLAVPVPKTPFNYYTAPQKFYNVFVVFFFSCVAYAHYLLAIRFKQEDKSNKNKLMYLFIGSSVGFIGGTTAFFPVFDWPIFPFGMYFVALYTLIIGFAIIRYRLMDIQTVIHKTFLWVVTSSLIIVPVGTIFYATKNWIDQLSNIQLSIFVSTLFALTIPYFKFIQPRIDHLFQRRKYDMQKILQGMVKELATLKNLDRLIEKIAATIKEALYVSKITLILWDDKSQSFKGIGPTEKDIVNIEHPFFKWMKEQDQVIEIEEIELNPKYKSVRHLARSYFQKFNAKVVLPLIHDGKLVGIINLGEKDNLKSFSKMDIDFLSNLRTGASIALSNSLLYDNVHKMSEELKRWSIELEHKVDERTRELAESKHQLEESYAKLKELDRLKTEFFANVNHELRTPLTLILLPLEMILNNEYGAVSPEMKKSLTAVRANGLRLLNLINGLLDLAKTDAGKMELFKNKYDLNLIVQGIVSSLSLMADKRNIRLTYSAESEIPEFYFDREKIERVFINLISNALKFTGPEGSIWISLEVKGGLIEARVRDTGIGVPASYLEKIFERFTQVDSSSSRKYQGSGLGLALCKEFVEMHHGKIWVESELDKGSVFSFTIPLMTALEDVEDYKDRREAEFETNLKRRSEDLTKSLSVSALYQSSDWIKPEQGEEKTEGGKKKRYQILVAEDDLQMQNFICSILRKEHSVLTAKNGVEGVQSAKAYMPDLIISDVMMPLKDGYQLCREVKADKRTGHIPVILLTAKSEASNKIEGFEHGADEYLTKPFNMEELTARVRSLLKLKELEKESAHSQKMAAMAVMVAGVVHEINNPVSFTRTSWEIISEAFERFKAIGDSSEITSNREELTGLIKTAGPALEIVKKGIDRIQEVVNRLKVFDGSRALHFERLSLNRLMDRSVARFEEGFPSFPKERIVFFKDYQLNREIEGMPLLLTQLFEVILDNAIKAVGERGSIWIKTWSDDEDRVWISIKDNGRGIKKEKLEHLFEPFFTLRNAGEGMGLGLFLAYQVIQAHHGSITVKSIENEGTEMIVSLPATRPNPGFIPKEHPVQQTH
jgi:signal transduction histidine kinase